MRITRNMLEAIIADINNVYALSLSVKYFNGCTHIYISGNRLLAGTTSECFNQLNIFMVGFYFGKDKANSEVKIK